MFGLETLDVLIGLVTVYLVFGIACTAILETIESWLNMRSSNLEAALREFLAGDFTQNEIFVTKFYEHPLVQALSKGTNGRPSYIPPEIVGLVVEQILTVGGTVGNLPEAVNLLPGTHGNNRIKGLLHTLVIQANGDVTLFRKAVETHFNSVMDRASGWYKRHTQNVALLVAAVLVIGANVDTIALATLLASSPTARVKLVEIADLKVREKQVEGGKGITIEEEKTQVEAADRAASEMESAGIQFGWKDCPKTFKAFLAKVVGLLVSIFAVSLGAPFWFEICQRFMQVRATGKKPKKPKSGSN